MTILANICITIVLSVLRRRFRKFKNNQPVPNSGSEHPTKTIMLSPRPRQIFTNANTNGPELNSLPTMAFSNKKGFDGIFDEAEAVGLPDV